MMMTMKRNLEADSQREEMPLEDKSNLVLAGNNKYIVKHSSHVVTCKRLRLDNALAQGSMEGWSSARIKAYEKRSSAPNSYYYRFNDPEEPQRNGKWTEEEHDLFMQRIKEVDVNGQWGVFSMGIPGRVGYQCSNYYRKLVQAGLVKDSNYVLDEQGKAHYLHNRGRPRTNCSKPEGPREPSCKVLKKTGAFGKCGELTYSSVKIGRNAYHPGDFVMIRNQGQDIVVKIREVFLKSAWDGREAVPYVLGRRFLSQNQLKDSLEGGEKALEELFAKRTSKATEAFELIETSLDVYKFRAIQIVEPCEVKFVSRVPKAKMKGCFFVRFFFCENEKALVRRVNVSGKILVKSALMKEINKVLKSRRAMAWREQQSQLESLGETADESESEDEDDRAGGEEEISEYEKQRLQRIQENLCMLDELGL